jgi:integrase
MMPTKLWRKSLGERGLRVYLFERTPGGTLYREVYAGGQRVAPQKSLRHRDRERAEAEAYVVLAKLKAREEALSEGKLKLSSLFDMYVVSPAHRAKSPRIRKGDESMLNRLIAFLGPERDVRSLSLSDVERYTAARRIGELGRKPVGARTVGKELVALRTMLNWATREKAARSEPLLESNPLKGMRPPVEKNPLRPVETYDRYVRLMQVVAEVDWRLSLALALAESTGQRIGSILRVRRCDVDLDRLPHGRILFRAENQKTGFEHWVPLSEECRQHLLAHLRKVRSEPDAWLFPAERNPQDAVSVWVISTSLRRAYQRAGMDTLKGGLWHPWRRKWATERKDMPLRDVAAAGGWRDPTTLLKCYQQPDEETMRRVVLEAPKLLSRPVRRLEVTPKATPGEAAE